MVELCMAFPFLADRPVCPQETVIIAPNLGSGMTEMSRAPSKARSGG
jgi:hypothetical protein